MKGRAWIAAGVIAASILTAAAAAYAITAKTYQVTGTVLELSPTLIVVQKGKERWEIVRDPSIQSAPDLKAGEKVTIEYRMTATSITSKAAKAATAGTSPSKGKGAKKAKY